MTTPTTQPTDTRQAADKNRDGRARVKVDRQCPRCRVRVYHRAVQVKGCTFEAYCTNCGHQFRVRLRKTRDEMPDDEGECEHGVGADCACDFYSSMRVLAEAE